MDIPKRIFDILVDRTENAMKDSQLELEARIVPGHNKEKALNRVGFDRVLRYLSKTKSVYEPEHTVLDVTRGMFRVSLTDENRIAEQCSMWNKRSLIQMYESSQDSIIAVRKEPVQKPIDVSEYNILISLKRETNQQDPTEALKYLSSPNRPMTFRLKKRYSFVSSDGSYRIDCTAVKSASSTKIDDLASADEMFEIEVELLDGETVASKNPLSRANAETIAKGMLNTLSEILVVLRDTHSMTLITSTERSKVINEYSKLTSWRSTQGPKPVTLERGNLLPETVDNFSIRDDGPVGLYTATDKADGNRYLMFINSQGKGYLIDDSRNVIPTDISVPGAANSLLDGEYVRKSRLETSINLFLVFDVYFSRGKDLRSLPLVDFDNPDTETRLRSMRKDGDIGAPLSNLRNPEIRLKEFVPLSKAEQLYKRYDGTTGPEYNIDGLILTPAKLSVFQERPDEPPTKKSGTWTRVYKWKPPKDNSVDFEVQFDKTSQGDMAVYSGKMKARLKVGMQVAEGNDPYEILSGALLEQDYRRRTFEAPDYKMRVMSNPDSAGSGMYIHNGRELPRCLQPPNDTIYDGSIVEFTWDETNGVWSPLRVRHDKDSPNDIDTALSVWRSIAFPVQIQDIVDPDRVTDAGAGSKDMIYFDEVTAGDGAATDAMRRFHRTWIIDRMMFRMGAAFVRSMRPPSSTSDDLRIIDMACGRGADIRSWMRNGYDVVVGLDLLEDNLMGTAKTAAYARLAKIRDKLKDQGMRYSFVPMDVSKPVGPEAVEEISNPSLKKIGQTLWRTKKGKSDPRLIPYDGLALKPFDVVSCQFALHYFFESRLSLETFLDNVASNLDSGGIFIGTCMDGMAVDEEFTKRESELQSDNVTMEAFSESGSLVWRIEKRYNGRYDPVEGDEDEEIFGKPIGVYMETINKVNQEYLVHFPTLVTALEQRGMRLLNVKELDQYGIDKSSGLFGSVYNSTSWEEVERDVENPYEASIAKMIKEMSPDLKTFSFMNRYFVFTKI
ncbi:mRNA capping enzyme [Tetraselmis virus 1]|uniref:mRNA capping enzyme n=1 Tax=Tetraselmis virus 1 TaxID=2060617 RepID=A0A2P0VMR0_9VIRU|nr:mRNA capping enzyme [Tetraselmis virus 1]AUF82182.1 mRNA capping enzyme [Tetraselmis virus 1]